MSDVYETPMLIELGEFAALTQGFLIGDLVDGHGFFLI
ncbi:lasso RiPP family leader peptide-containing protein [Kitasatospora sp. NPDC048722]